MPPPKTVTPNLPATATIEPTSRPTADLPATATIQPTSRPTALPATIEPTPAPTVEPGLPAVAFANALFKVNESEGYKIIIVQLNQSSKQSVQVDYTTADGSATENSDYFSANGIMLFSPGQTVLTFTVPIMDNNIDDADSETVLLTLSQPQNVTIADPNAILEIADNDAPPILQFSSNAFRVSENQSSFLTVTLSHPSGQFVSVSYDIINSDQTTAIAGQDYQKFSYGSLGFAPDATGATPTIITFTWSELINNSRHEPNRTMMFGLINPPLNATLGVLSTTVLTIVDDD